MKFPPPIWSDDNHKSRRRWMMFTWFWLAFAVLLLVNSVIVLGSWPFTLFDIFLIVINSVTVAMRLRLHRRWPLCPQCDHLMQVHIMKSPDPLHTWGWGTCNADDCDCWGTWTEATQDGITLHTTAEVKENIAQWVERTGEAAK